MKKLLLFVIISTKLYSQQAITSCSPNVTTSLVALYDFTGNSNDLSGNGHNGTESLVFPTNDRFGNANSAYNFLGGSYIDLGTNINLGSAYTLNTWINCNSQSDGAIISKINTNGSNAFKNFELRANDNNSQKFSFTSLNGSSWFSTVSTSNLNTGTWYMLTAIHDNTVSSIYLNGVLEVTRTITINPQSITNTYIGQRGSDGTFGFDGDIDDVRIYNRALSQCDIDSLYNMPNPLITGVKNNVEDNFSVYPNPASDKLFIKNIAQDQTISIYNTFGELVLRERYLNGISLEHLVKGVYTLQIISNDNTYARKIIKD